MTGFAGHAVGGSPLILGEIGSGVAAVAQIAIGGHPAAHVHVVVAGIAVAEIAVNGEASREPW